MPKPTIVLVHGAWADGSSWNAVATELRSQGFPVFTPPNLLRGVAIDAPYISSFVAQRMTGPVVLVGHSYGGFVITNAAAGGGDVRALVYVDAFVPGDGDSAYRLLGVPPSGPPRPGDAWLVDGPARVYDDPAEEAFAVARRTPQPNACFAEPVRLSRPLEDWPFPRTYVRLTVPEPGVPPNPAFDAAAARARNSSAWRYAELATTHMAPPNRPVELTELLLASG